MELQFQYLQSRPLCNSGGSAGAPLAHIHRPTVWLLQNGLPQLPNWATLAHPSNSAPFTVRERSHPSSCSKMRWPAAHRPGNWKASFSVLPARISPTGQRELRKEDACRHSRLKSAMRLLFGYSQPFATLRFPPALRGFHKAGAMAYCLYAQLYLCPLDVLYATGALCNILDTAAGTQHEIIQILDPLFNPNYISILTFP